MVWLALMGNTPINAINAIDAIMIHIIYAWYVHLYRMGKTTLLMHIAERKLAIPPNIDVLYCEQGKSCLFVMLSFVFICCQTFVS
jgi:hypothetical protein